jgi:hypothetical protein
MKTLLPVGWFRSDAAFRNWIALTVATSISCFPVVSAFANGHNGGGNGGGGGHMASGGHGGGGGHMAGGGHGGGGGRMAGGGHGGSGGRIAGGGHGGGSGRIAGGGHAAGNGHVGASGHVGTTARPSDSHRSAALFSNTGRSLSRQNQSGHAVEHRVTKVERQNNGLATNKSVVRRRSSGSHSFVESRRAGRGNHADLRLQTRAASANSTRTFDRSIARSRAQVFMNQRLSQISSRQWTGHGQVCSDHFDRGRRCWFRHGGYWWRCNFWGAHSYCNRLIAIGFAPGLCWGWYDDICWGNVVVGMPIDLVDYYYPDPVYTTYATYNGDEATVYYYALGNGEYKRVTVVDGDVVDVQIVDEIASV